MWLAYPFVVFGGITATVLSAPITNDAALVARTEQESTRAAARVLVPACIAPEALPSLRGGSPPAPLEKRGNERRQDGFGYSDYDDHDKKSKRQYGYSGYDGTPGGEKRQISSGSDRPAITKRQDSFGYSDYDSDQPKRERRQYGYSNYVPLDKSQRENRQEETSAEVE